MDTECLKLLERENGKWFTLKTDNNRKHVLQSENPMSDTPIYAAETGVQKHQKCLETKGKELSKHECRTPCTLSYQKFRPKTIIGQSA